MNIPVWRSHPSINETAPISVMGTIVIRQSVLVVPLNGMGGSNTGRELALTDNSAIDRLDISLVTNLLKRKKTNSAYKRDLHHRFHGDFLEKQKTIRSVFQRT